MTIATVNQLSNGQWVVSVLGDVAVGNGRTAFGYIRDIKCADRECAENVAATVGLQAEQEHDAWAENTMNERTDAQEPNY